MPRVKANSKSVSFVTFAFIFFSKRLKTEADNLFDIQNHIQSECEWKHRREKPMQRERAEKYIRVRKKEKQSKGGTDNKGGKKKNGRCEVDSWSP